MECMNIMVDKVIFFQLLNLRTLTARVKTVRKKKITKNTT